MSAQTVRVLVADGHLMFADGIRLLLGAAEGFEVVGAVPSLEETLRLAHDAPPDVLLVDPDLPGAEDPVAALVVALPEVRIVVLTGTSDPDEAVAALAAGACGAVPKTESLERLAEIVRQAAAGEMVLPAADLPLVLERLQRARAARAVSATALESLTVRETEILRALARGESTAGVAGALGISRLTVQSHVKSILAKLGVHSKLEAITIAWRHGLAETSRTA